jgi:Ca2+-binding RTX toxin-like protein
LIVRGAGSAIALAVAALILAPAMGAATGQMCLGKRATMVLGQHDGFGRGTADADVIVVRGPVIAVEAHGGDDRICNRAGGAVPILDGGPGADEIKAGRGGGFVSAGGGDDIVHGGPQGEVIYDGGGSDTYAGGGGHDIVDYHFAEHPLDANLQAGSATVGGDGDGLAGIEGLVGTDQADTISGTDGEDFLSGGRGADTIAGLLGPDVLIGGRGRDVVDGGGGRDRCDAEQLTSCERRFPPLPNSIGPHN